MVYSLLLEHCSTNNLRKKSRVIINYLVVVLPVSRSWVIYQDMSWTLVNRVRVKFPAQVPNETVKCFQIYFSLKLCQPQTSTHNICSAVVDADNWMKWAAVNSGKKNLTWPVFTLGGMSRSLGIVAP